MFPFPQLTIYDGHEVITPSIRPCSSHKVARLTSLLTFLFLVPALHAQSMAQADNPDIAPGKGRSYYTVFGGYSFISNCPNGVSGSHQPLNGWDTSIAAVDWHHLRFKLDISGYYGTNLNASQRMLVVTAGAEYRHHFGRKYAFLEALMGDANATKYWGANGTRGETATFSTLLGGGLDVPIRPRLSFRAQGDFQYLNFHPYNAQNSPTPVTSPPVTGLPNFYGHAVAGLAWRF